MTVHWFTAAELARLHQVTPGRVHQLASRHRWRRTGTRPQRYRYDDVRDSQAFDRPGRLA